MVKRNNWVLLIILVLVAFCVWTLIPLDGVRFGRKGITLGLDLKGGTRIVYTADMTKKDPTQTDAQVMSAIKSTIERRVNAFGVTEPTIQVYNDNTIEVQLPGVKDVQQAIDLIGQVALLEFKEEQYDADGKAVTDANGNPVWIASTATGSDGTVKTLTGAFLKPNSTAAVDPTTGKAEVLFNWNTEGALLFKEITTRNLNKPIAIYLDNNLIESATVQAVITDSGRITGLTLDDAKNLAIELNSGTLSVPLTITAQDDPDATLGADSLRMSLEAGLIGIALVMLFMIAYYRWLGVVAAVALLIYGAIALSIFKLWPITLTLTGIAGFIISVGMAVDANVLIFERMREEMRLGLALNRGVAEGFRRAWPSIRDSNVSTFITCIILYWFGNITHTATVKGFAVTLFLGVAVSMFTAITVTRTFLVGLVSTDFGKEILTRSAK